jgi:hypothetical protein
MLQEDDWRALGDTKNSKRVSDTLRFDVLCWRRFVRIIHFDISFQKREDPNYEGNLDIKNVVIPNPVQIKSRQIGIIVPKIILAGSHLGSAYSFHNLFFSKYGSLNLSFILLVRV